MPKPWNLAGRIWTNIRVQDFRRLLAYVRTEDCLDISDREIEEGHHRTVVAEQAIQAAYALGQADAVAEMGIRIQSSYDELWEALGNPPVPEEPK